MQPIDLDLFAGPGGWDEAAASLGLGVLGIELDAECCKTREAAGHRTRQGDVAALAPEEYGPVRLLIASPPCQTYSTAGSNAGIADQNAVYTCARLLARGEDTRGTAPVTDTRSLLVVEPLRWALALRPAYIACEQVPPALGLWKLFAEVLRAHGYKAWAGELNAADYGVPQVRRRAFLLASLEHAPQPPAATHAREPAADLFRPALLPWVTMAEALGWGMTARPYFTIATSRTSGGPDPEGVGGASSRDALYREREEGRWLVGFPRKADGGEAIELEGVSYRLRDLVSSDEPAPTVTGRGGLHRWPYERPATTGQGERRGDQAIRITHEEGAVLQGFRRDYPWRGNSTARWRQIGNAVPPPLARAVLKELLNG